MVAKCDIARGGAGRKWWSFAPGYSATRAPAAAIRARVVRGMRQSRDGRRRRDEAALEKLGKEVITVSEDAPKDGYLEKQILCPHCGQCISFGISAKVFDPQRHDRAQAPRIPEEQSELIEKLTKLGILKAFEETVLARTTTSGIPKDMGGFLLHALKMARPRAIPRESMDLLIREFGRQTIECWSSQGILIVIVDGRLRMFAPFEVAAGEPVKTIGGRLSFRTTVDGVDLEKWLRTKMGYVPQDAKFFMSELRSKSIGQYANISRIGAATRI